ncbi:isocitrate dehydrogenase [Nonlabens dokdonensis]|jgi:isocitrate dehydrogenase|uniref:Isocitrate dehydrogenase [NADP] n=2 Tax=Nonlabens dokdonensis TaxID=328515 RepID=L7WHX9_NONDD|nr:NADP-dependent isocitrate dehydrogenase [Nonlabens dokdonensis]AGC78613.1 isocitrate dehydrogenase (NADP) (Oxalosuccinatedecarboxylase) (Idh) (Nadp(+)-specific icdh) [Nonlabens dokdonensis DSW-6]PZX39257.1 isocitrate dehydrogenase [Nonlabens dokdonensis]
MKKITIAKGDGIGPEIMDATLKILTAAKAPIEWDEVAIGEQVYLSGNTTGIPQEAWDTIRRNKIFLKAPITTPQGKGYKSLNVTLRKTLGLFANVRPCNSFSPYIATKHPDMDVVIVRENEEDLYAGIEHRQTDEVYQCLKLITRPGCEKIVRYAFEYAKLYNRKKVSCFVKDNIMKLTDGLFHTVFKEIAKEYPEIESDSWIVDIAAAKIANEPELFDVVVLPNLYGDIVSDITAEISGSVGLAGSSNIGEECSMFEAIHGSAPLIAGKKIANPSGLLRGAIMMLNHIGEQEVAMKIKNAWSCAIEEGIHTADIYKEGTSKRLVNTMEFADAVIVRLGQKPQQLPEVQYDTNAKITIKKYERPVPQAKNLVGVDVFIDWRGKGANQLAEELSKANNGLELKMITNRGVKVWPNGFEETFCTDHWRCRFEKSAELEQVSNKNVVHLLGNIGNENLDAIKTENLYEFDGQLGYSLGQGQ